MNCPELAEQSAKYAQCIMDQQKALQKSIQHIRQLCDMVNGFSERAGLGRKVRAEDFAEPAADCLKKWGGA